MEHITFDFLLGFILAVGLMVALWVPLFFFDYKAEKKRGASRWARAKIPRHRHSTRCTSTRPPVATCPRFRHVRPGTGGTGWYNGTVSYLTVCLCDNYLLSYC